MQWQPLRMGLLRYGISLALVAGGCPARSANDEGVLMEAIEADVRLPNGAKNLSDYARYYYRDGTKVVGIYVSGDKPGRRWVMKSKAPVIMDGGCGVVNVVFDVASRRVTSTFCNGAA